MAALQQAAQLTSEQNVSMSKASASNPGIPPSSLMSFLRHKPSIQGVVIEEFDRDFSNAYFQSEGDTPSLLDAQPMIGAGDWPFSPP